MRNTILLTILFLLSATYSIKAQDLLSLIEEESDSVTTQYAEASFKTTRVVNSLSLENTSEGVLDFKISHRFGELSDGAYELFGLDQASMRIGLDYGVTERLMIGVGRSTYQKTYDGFLKYKILRQSSGAKKMPISLQWVSNMSINTLKLAEDSPREDKFTHRLTYVHQMLIGRKFSEGTTVQLMPTLVHRNLVDTKEEENDVLAFGVAGRQKLTKRISLNAEYYYVLPDQLLEDRYFNSVSMGFDIETGGHVFSLHVTNSEPMIEKGFITETTGDWFDGNIRFGFNISRVFTIKKPKEFRKK